MDRRAYSQENRNKRADSVAKTVVISPKAEAETPNPTGIKSLFEGLSVSQVTAGALAAVTSMLLSAQIGIAGSVIGVAVGSVVSTVSSQLYKKFLAGSAEKLRGFASSDNEEENAAANAVAAQSCNPKLHTRANHRYAHHARAVRRRRNHHTAFGGNSDARIQRSGGSVGQFRRNERSIRGPNRWSRCARHARQPSRSRHPIEYAAHQ